MNLWKTLFPQISSHFPLQSYLSNLTAISRNFQRITENKIHFSNVADVKKVSKVLPSNKTDRLPISGGIAADQVVTLHSGAGKLIQDFDAKVNENMLSWLYSNDQCFPAQQTNFHYLGSQSDCLELILSDSRSIQCSGDQRFLVRNRFGRNFPIIQDETIRSKWVKASDIIPGDIIACAIEAPRPISISKSDESYYIFKDNCNIYKFRIADLGEQKQLLAYMRLLGFVHGDGKLIYGSGSQPNGYVIVAHQLVIHNLLVDIKTVTNEDAVYYQSGALYRVILPQQLCESFLSLYGESSDKYPFNSYLNPTNRLPLFLFDCPLSVLQEFLGGLFGAQGHAPFIKSGNDKKRKDSFVVSSLLQVKFQPSDPSQSEFFAAKLTSLSDLTKLIGFKTQFKPETDGKNEESTSDSNNSNSDSSSSSSTRISSSGGGSSSSAAVHLVHGFDTLEFSDLIGYRYDTHRQIRLSIANTWFRLRKTIIQEINTITEQTITAKASSFRLKFRRDADLIDHILSKYEQTQHIFGGLLTRINATQMDNRIRKLLQNSQGQLDNLSIHRVIPVKKYLQNLGLYDVFKIIDSAKNIKYDIIKANDIITSSSSSREENNMKFKTKASEIAHELNIQCECQRCSIGKSNRTKSLGIEKHWNGLPAFGLECVRINRLPQPVKLYSLGVDAQYKSYVVNGIIVQAAKD